MIDTEMPWKEVAACLGLDTAIFFPDPPEEDESPKAICAVCPVSELCLDWSQSKPHVQQYGIWGGLNEVERRRIRRHQREAAFKLRKELEADESNPETGAATPAACEVCD